MISPCHKARKPSFERLLSKTTSMSCPDYDERLLMFTKIFTLMGVEEDKKILDMVTT